MPSSDDPAKGELAKETLEEKYLLEEMKLLRGEVELRGQEQRNMEKYVIIADAAIYAFLLKDKLEGAAATLAPYAWYIPPVLAALAYIRWFESVRMIDRLAEYIARRETRIIKSPDFGWETFLDRKRLTRTSSVPGLNLRPMMPHPYAVFWSLLIAGTLSAAWLNAPVWPFCRVWVALGLFAVIFLGVFTHLLTMQRQWLASRTSSSSDKPSSAVGPT
jgi:hypothetical protein